VAKTKKVRRPLTVIGWREWVALPGLSVPYIRVKVDTGAQTSALHAFNLERFEHEDGREWVSFEVHPLQHKRRPSVAVEAPMHDLRRVRSSNGRSELRPVILTDLGLPDQSWPIELTLTRRDEMTFRMLLGREALRGHCLVDTGKSYLLAAPAGAPETTKKPTKKG